MSKYRNSQKRRATYEMLACFGVAGFGVGILGTALFVQCAVAVAHGQQLHIGADILLAGLPVWAGGTAAAEAQQAAE
jgi:hypothetical protein